MQQILHLEEAVILFSHILYNVHTSNKEYIYNLKKFAIEEVIHMRCNPLHINNSRCISKLTKHIVY